MSTTTSFRAGQQVAVVEVHGQRRVDCRQVVVDRVLTSAIVTRDGHRYSPRTGWRLAETRAPYHCIEPWTARHDVEQQALVDAALKQNLARAVAAAEWERLDFTQLRAVHAELYHQGLVREVKGV